MKRKSRAKMCLSLLLCLIMAISMIPNMNVKADPDNGEKQEENEDPKVYYGDVDDDGEVDPKDVTSLRRHLVGGWNVTINEDKADANADGAVDPKDVTTLRRYLAGGWGVVLPEAPAEIVESEWQLNNVIGYITDYNNSPDLVRADGTLNDSCRSITWAMGDSVVPALQIAIEYVRSDTGIIRYEGFGNAGEVTGGKYIAYNVKSSNETIVMIKGMSGNRIRLIGNKAGIAGLVVYGITADYKQEIIGAIPVEIRSPRKPAILMCSTIGKNTLDLDNPDDSVEIMVNLRDQYAEEIRGTAISIENDPMNGAAMQSGNTVSGNTYRIYSSDVEKGKSNFLNAKITCESLTYGVLIKLENSGCYEPESDDVTTIEVPDQHLEPGQLTPISFIAKDSNGNEVSLEGLKALPGILSISLVDNHDLDVYMTGSGMFIGSANKTYTVAVNFDYLAKAENDVYIMKHIRGTGTVSSFINDEYSFDKRKGAELKISTGDSDTLVNPDGTKNGGIEDAKYFSMDTPDLYVVQIAVPYYNVNGTVYEGFGVDLEPAIYQSYIVESSNEDVVEIGEVTEGRLPMTCNSAGKTTITLYGVKDDQTKVKLAEKEIKVERATSEIPEPISMRQVSLNSVEVTFDKVVTGLLASDFKAYYLLAGETKYYPSAVERVTMFENKAIVKFYSNFREGTEYYLEYLWMHAGGFTTVQVPSDAVANVQLIGQTLAAGNQYDIHYKLFDKNGVDITDAPSLYGGTISFSANVDESVARIENNGSRAKIYVAEKDREFTITGTYSWTSADGKPCMVRGSADFESRAPFTWTLGDVYVLPVTMESDKVIRYGSLNTNAAKQLIIVDGAEYGNASAIAVGVEYRLRYNYETEDYRSRYETFQDAGNLGPYKSYKVVSTDENILKITEDSGYDRVGIIPVSAGTVTLNIYGVNELGESTQIGTYDATVYEKSVPVTITPVATSEKILLNYAYAEDCISFRVDVKDQYDKYMNGAKITIQQKEDSSYKYVGPESISAGKDVVLTPADFTSSIGDNNTTITLELSCGSKTSLFSFTMGNEAEVVTYKPVLSSTNINTGIRYDNYPEYLKVSLEGITWSGYSGMGHELKFVDARPVFGAEFDDTYQNGDIVYTVLKDGVLLSGDMIKNFDRDTNTFYGVSMQMMGENMPPQAVKMDAGTYVIEVYQLMPITNDPSRIMYRILDHVSFTVTDNQTLPTFSKTDRAEKLVALTNSEIRRAFEVKFMNYDVSSNVMYDFTSDGSTAYIKSLSYTINNPILGCYTVSVTVDTLVKLEQ